MSRNGSGTYNLPVNSWNPAVNGVLATSTDWQALANDLASALTQSISADGQTPITGNIPMSNFKLTGLAAGNAVGNSLRWEQLFSQGAETDIASASTVDIGAQNTTFLRVTGTTTITSFGTNYNGPRVLRFSDVLTLTHNATTLILPGGANITTSSGMVLIATPVSGGWQISSSNSAAAISFIQSGAGMTTRTAQDKMREQYTLLDVSQNLIPGVTDMSPALNQARASAGGRKIRIPAGHYKFNSVCTGMTDLIIEGDGDSTVLDFTGAVTGGNYALEAIGTATQIEELSGSQAAGTNTVTFVSTPSLSVGDVFVIYNPTDSSWSGFRPVYRAGEWCEVESISGSVVTTKNPLFDTYAAADVDVYKITGPKVQLKNFSIIGTTITGLINSELCIAPLVENITGTHANNSVISFARCLYPTLINPNIKNIGDGGDDYGVSIGNSQHCKIIGGNIYSRRHAVTHGGDGSVCCVPVRDSVITGVTLKNDIASGTESADFHGNTEASRYVNCTIFGGGNLQGKDNEYVDCTITSNQLGAVIYHAEVKGGRLGARGCKFITHVNPASSSRGIFDIGGNNGAITANTTLPATFFIENCSVYGRNLSTSTTIVRFRNAGSAQKMNFDVNGLTGDVDAIPALLRTALDSGTASSDYVIVDNIKNFPAGTTLHSAFGSSYLNFPHRCQKQTGKETLTATSGTAFTTGTLTSFRYSYPRAPSAHCTAVGGYNSNRMTYGTLNSLSATQIRPMIESGDATNWTGTSAREVYWTASLDEV